MLKYVASFALFLLFGGPSAPISSTGSWRVDIGHSDAQLITDATTDYGKTKFGTTLGFGRVNGRLVINSDNPSQSSFNFRFYPATGMTPVIDEDGKFLSEWLSVLSNQTLVCFHSKEVTKTPDGKLKATGELVLTRVDRNIDAAPSESYSGPVYGPPMIHRMSRQATFVFDFPADSTGQNNGIVASGTTSMFREDYPQLLKAVIGTYWPPVVQDKNCQMPAGVGEDYSGAQCSGKLLMAAALPTPPEATGGEDTGAYSNFNSIVGNRLKILVHLHLTPAGTAEASAAGN